MGEPLGAEAITGLVQTDKKGLGPDTAALCALDARPPSFASRPAGPPPLVIIESTLARHR